MKNTLLLASILIALARCESSTTSESIAPDGKAIYRQYCKLCHGADGQLGLNNAANLASSSLINEDLITVITYGRNTMQPYEEVLSAAEIDAVAAYVLSLRQP